MVQRRPLPFDVKLMSLTATVVFALCWLMLLAAGGWWVLRQPLFSLSAIRVDGDVVHNNAVTLNANVTPKLAGNFFTIDLQAARAAFETVPWVRKAVVRREFPNMLHVTLAEQQARAHWGDDAQSRLVNNFGEVFEANTADVDDDLPHLDGPLDQAAQVYGMHQTLAPLFKPYGMVLDALTLSARGSWQAELGSGAVIELGRGQGDEVAARTRRFLRTLGQVTSQYGRTVGSLESADLRHHDAYALRMRGIATVATAESKKN